MNIYLLTHQREPHRKTNTGALVADIMAEHCQVFMWDRTTPNQKLLQIIEQTSVALLYPSEGSLLITETPGILDGFIIIDATWQEAQKMYNHSPYLKVLPKVKLHRERPSLYTLRRNQKENGLCTAESAAEILTAYHEHQTSDRIEQALAGFILDR